MRLRFFTHFRRFVARYGPSLWLTALAAYILAGTPFVPFHGDEATQIYMSRDYAYLFLQGQLDTVRYSNIPVNPTEQHLRLLNGTLAKYLIGAAWHFAGFTVDDVNEQWDWGADWNYNQQNGHAPTPDLLLVARWPQAMLLAAGVGIMFVLGKTLGGRLTAYLASLYYALSPALLINGRRAMMEGSLTCFSLLTVLAGIWWLQKPSWRRALLLGVASGLALTSKHTAVFTVAAVFGACGLWTVGSALHRQGFKTPDYEKSKPTQGAKNSTIPVTILALGLALVVSAAVFLALNPAWWDAPVARIGQVLELRQEVMDIQVNVFGGYAGRVDQAAGFFRQTFIALPQYYEAPGWENYIGREITAYELSPWRGISLGGNLPGGLILVALSGLGFYALLHTPRIRWLMGLWVLILALATLLLTPLEWQRYYLPVYPVVGLLAAWGLSQGVAPLVRRLIIIVEDHHADSQSIRLHHPG